MYCTVFAKIALPTACTTVCTIGWVNSYQKFEIEKYTVCGKLIQP